MRQGILANRDASSCADAVLRVRLPATGGAVKPLPARAGRLVSQVGHAADGSMEPAAEILHAVDPGFAADPQPFQNRMEFSGDRPPFATPHLLPGGIEMPIRDSQGSYAGH